MSFKFTQVTGDKVFRPWTQWTKGDNLTGKLLRVGEDNYGKETYEIEVLECKFSEDEVSYTSKQGKEVVCKSPTEGQIFSLNANGSLTRAMESVSVGDVIMVVYNGMDTLTKGKYQGKDFHKLSVYKADGARTDEASEDLDESVL